MLKLSSVFLFAFCCAAQSFDLGVFGGFGTAPSLTAVGPAGHAEAGTAGGFAAGAALIHDAYEHLGGEARYTFRRGDLRLASGGTEARFNALSHSFFYNFLVYPTSRKARVRPFLAAGGGARIYQGTGVETPFQPLNQYALLTKTREFQPLITGGGGITGALSSRISLRVELLDYITPAPTKVIAATGAAARGWLHDLTPMVGLTFRLGQ